MVNYDKGFETWFKTIFVKNKHEGGIADRDKKADPGGLTNKGITWKYFVAENWGKYIGKTSDSKTFYALSDNEVKTIAYNAFYKRFGLQNLKSEQLKPLAMDTVWGSGSLKSLGASTVSGLNQLILNGKTMNQFKSDRKNWLQKLKNAKHNPGWFVRLDDVFNDAVSFGKNNLGLFLLFFILIFFAFYKNKM